MSVLEFFQWCDSSFAGVAIRDSKWLFPVIETGHLLGLSVMGGAVLMVDLRLLGFGLTRQSIQQVARDAQPWLDWSLGVMLVTGALLFTSEATKAYYNLPFWVKIASLALAIVFTFTVKRSVLGADEGRVGPARRKVVALVSLALWTTVGIGGRYIGFY